MQKNWFLVFKVKVTARAYISEYDCFYYLLNCWPFCYQTWFDGTFSYLYAGMSCEKKKKRLLWSRSRSQWIFKVLMNVCPHNIFWTTETVFNQTWNSWLVLWAQSVTMDHIRAKTVFSLSYSDASSLVRVKRLVCCLHGQGDSEGFIWWNYDFLICLLSCWFFCN